MRILLLEPDRLFAEGLRSALSARGHAVDLGGPVIDLRPAPGVDGADVVVVAPAPGAAVPALTAARQLASRADIVVMFDALASGADVEAVNRHGARASVEKGASLAELVSVIEGGGSRLLTCNARREVRSTSILTRRDLKPPDPVPRVAARTEGRSDTIMTVQPEAAAGAMEPDRRRPDTDPPGSSSRRRPPLGQVLVMTDLVAIALAWSVGGAIVIEGSRRSIGALTLLACVLTPLAMAGLGLYRSLVCTAFVVELSRTVMAVGVTLSMLLLADAAGMVQLDGAEAAGTSVVSAVLLLAGRGGFRAWVTAERAAGHYHRPLVLVGRTSEVLELLTFYEEHPEVGYRVDAIVSDEPLDRPGGPHWLGRFDDPQAVAAVGPYGGAVVALSGLPSSTTNHLVRRLTLDGVNVHVHTGLTRIRHGRLRALPLAHEPLHYFATDRLTGARQVAKRAIDLMGASLALILATPLLLVAMALVRLEDGRPTIFRQRRVGVGGREFEMLKLRTMVCDAESRRAALLEHNLRRGPLFKAEDDPRITRVGRWMRALSVDELPQLINVLRGEMSLVGPRPALPTETALFDDELQRRHDVRPGITGLWQIEARDNPSIHEYRRLDLYYVENWTLAGDVSILARTAGAVLVKGSRRLVRGERR